MQTELETLLLLLRRSAPQRYATAIAIFGAALALRFLILPVAAPGAFLTFYPAAVLAFLLTGHGPGRVVVALGAAAGFYIFTPPNWSLAPTKAGLLSVTAFIAVGLVVGWIIERLRDTASRLRVNEQHYRSLIEEQSDLVALSRPDGHLVYANPAYARHFGRTQDEMIDTSLFAFVDAADRDAVAQQIDAVLRSGTSRTGENRMVGADGVEKWVAWTNSVRVGPAGEPLVQSVGRDITERNRIEAALRASQALLERTGRIAGVGGWELDLVSQAVTWSDETRRIHEVGPDFVPTLDQAILFYAPEARPVIEAAVRRSMDTGEPWDLELAFVTATGRRIWVRSAGEVERENDQPVRLAGAFQDITERRQLAQRLADSEAFLRQIADSVPLRIAYLDRDRRYRFVNRELLRHFGREREQVIGRTRADLRPDADDAAFAAQARAALAGQAQQFEFEEVVDGQLRRFENRLVPDRAESGEVRGFFLAGIDITAAVLARQEVQRQTETLRSVTEAIPASVAVVGADSRYRFVNSAFERGCGRPRADILGREASEVLGEAEFGRRQPWAQRALAGEAVTFTLDYPGADGRMHLTLSYIPLHLDTGEIDGFVAVSQDITPHKREERRLIDLSQRDPLTGLLNRAGLAQRLEQMAQVEGGRSLAVLYIDLDHFKPVNDRHGHPVGDELLRLVGQRLLNLVRPSDVVARLGGDEFAIVLAGVHDGADARVVADKVLAAAHAPFHVGTLLLGIGASVGVAHGVDPAHGWADLVTRADAQLLIAKAAGRGRLMAEAR